MIAPPSDLSLEVLTNRVRLTWVDNSGVEAGYRIAVSSYSGMTAYNNAKRIQIPTSDEIYLLKTVNEAIERPKRLVTIWYNEGEELV